MTAIFNVTLCALSHSYNTEMIQYALTLGASVSIHVDPATCDLCTHTPGLGLRHIPTVQHVPCCVPT